MAIHQLIKEVMTKHQKKIELFQWAVIGSISTLVYSEYISKMKQKQVPVKKIMIIPIKYVKEFLAEGSPFMDYLSNNLIDMIINNKEFIKYKHAPEFEIFNEENIEVLKTVFDLYITPNISRRIPESIYIKFNLGDESQQLFVEDNTIDLFNREPITEQQYQYIADECVLQMLWLIPTMVKHVEPVENNQNILMTKDEVLIIDHQNALYPIYINEDIINNEDVIKLLEFVTSTKIIEAKYGDSACAKGPDNTIVKYEIESNPFNQIIISQYSHIQV